MPTLQAVHRPQTIDEALALLERTDVRSAILAGGTSLVAGLPGEFDELIDLQALELDTITRFGADITLGATVRLQTIVDLDHEEMPDLLRRMAWHEGPNTLRNAATIGGVVASASADSELLAALLALDAVVSARTTAAVASYPLADFLAHRDERLPDLLITAISFGEPSASGHARVARTPRDRPIVAAVAARNAGGDTRLALCGVAETPILIAPDALDTLEPAGDFRGSAAYRKAMAAVVSRRALDQLGQ